MGKKLFNLFVYPVARKRAYLYGLIYLFFILFAYPGFLIVELEESASKMRCNLFTCSQENVLQ